MARWSVYILVLFFANRSAHADDVLTLSRVIELARARAPDPQIARARIDEAAGGFVGARQRTTRNVTLQADVGPRIGDGRSTDLQTTLSFPLELGGRRAGRVAVVQAAVEHERTKTADVERVTIGNAVAAYYRVLHSDRRLALAEERVRLADEAEATARQRMRAGDIAEFEVNLARGEVARAKSAVVAATGDRVRARAELANILGISNASTTVSGDLGNRAALERAGTPTDRSDLRMLAQEVRLASAEGASARTSRWPQLDLRFSFEHEREADIILGGVALELPTFDRGQGDHARAAAREKRARTELAVRTSQISSYVESARIAYDAAVAASQILEREAIPLSIDNATAAFASYRAGKLDIGALLVIRREALDTRREHLDRLLDAALAGVDLWIARGAP